MSNLYESSRSLYPIENAIAETEEFIKQCWKDWEQEDYLPIKQAHRESAQDAQEDLDRMKRDQDNGVKFIEI